MKTSADRSQGDGQSRQSRESGNPGVASVLDPRFRGGDETGLPKCFSRALPGPWVRSGGRLQAGVTMVEALIVVALGVLLVGATLAALWWTRSTLEQAQDRLEPREQAVMALTVLSSSLRDCWHYRIDDAGARIRFVTPRLQGEARWDRAERVLHFKPPGTAGAGRVLAERVRLFRAESEWPGCLRLTLSLDRPPAAGRQSRPTAPLVMVQEVYAPAVGGRDPLLPWSPALEHRAAMLPSY